MGIGLILGSPPAGAAVDALWMLTARSGWLRLTRERGWTPQQWESWSLRHAREDLLG